MNKYRFVALWDEDISVDWQKTSRVELNKIIKEYNQWQIDGFNIDATTKLLSLIEYGKQTIGSQDGGSGYLEELIDMENFVNENIN